MAKKSKLSYFISSFVFTIVGLIAGFFIGETAGGTFSAGLESVFIVGVLAVLEVSLSFDNAVVNATVLKDMSPIWRKRFMTWGILIAVFGMRIVFPLLIVGIVAHLNPVETLRLAIFDPAHYAEIMTSIHTEIMAFGGSFLLLVGLKYFLDEGKEIHWLAQIEEPLTKLGRLESFSVAIALIVLLLVAQALPPEKVDPFLIAGVCGVVIFILVDGLGAFLESRGASNVTEQLHRASFASFLYLEVLDASFSFDGVVGAFAVSDNLLIIALGLGIGAMFVRSLTIMLVDNQTLEQFVFLEHGAFYAIVALAAMMFIGTIAHVSEVFTGLIGAFFIGLSLFSSVRHKRRSLHGH